MANALSKHWSDISCKGGGSPEACLGYLRSLPIPASLKRLALALFKPLTQGIWRRPSSGRSLGPPQALTGLRYLFTRNSKHGT